jgi:hypothetical protein
VTVSVSGCRSLFGHEGMKQTCLICEAYVAEQLYEQQNLTSKVIDLGGGSM